MLTQISENVNSFRHPAIAKRSADTQLRTDPSVRYTADGIVTDKGRSLLLFRSLPERAGTGSDPGAAPERGPMLCGGRILSGKPGIP